MNPFVILDESQVKRLKRAVQTECELVVCLGDWLSHLNLFSDAQIYDILKFFREQVESFDSACSAGLAQPAVMLAVCDSRWVSVTGGKSFWDTNNSEAVDELGEFALTHIMCDIGVLRARLKYRQGRFNHESQKQTAASPAGPARESS